MKLSQQSLILLKESSISGNKLVLPGTLSRAEYISINKLLELMGLKWSRKDKCHVSEHDVEELINQIINTGEWVDEKNLNQFYPTPDDVIAKMLDLMCIHDGDVILEPSAGDGAILKAIRKLEKNRVTLYYCELNDTRMVECADLAHFLGNDFLTEVQAEDWTGPIKIIMNPPFSNQQDIDHVSHAIDILQSGGRFVSVMSESTFFRRNKKTIDFHSKLYNECENVYVLELPEGAFKASGTMVKTRLVYGEKR